MLYSDMFFKDTFIYSNMFGKSMLQTLHFHKHLDEPKNFGAIGSNNGRICFLVRFVVRSFILLGILRISTGTCSSVFRFQLSLKLGDLIQSRFQQLAVPTLLLGHIKAFVI